MDKKRLIKRLMHIDGLSERFINEISEFYPNKFSKTKVIDKNVFIYGKPGTGKTLKAISIALDTIGNIKKLNTGTFAFGNVPEILFQIRQTYNPNFKPDHRLDIHLNETPEERIINTYTNPKYLILDDIGAEKTTDFSLQALYLIVNRRYEAGKLTFTTSNLSPIELDEKMEDGRLVSRLTGGAILLEMTKQYRI